MMTTRVAGEDFELDSASVERAVAGVDPEPIREHYVVIGQRRYPPKQVLAAVTGLDRGDAGGGRLHAVHPVKIAYRWEAEVGLCDPWPQLAHMRPHEAVST